MEIQIKDIKYDYGKLKVPVPTSSGSGSSGGSSVWTVGDKDGIAMPGCTASGRNAVAEGYNTEATGNYGSHAEGAECVASGLNAHAEGGNTVASGGDSHSEGQDTVASANNAHAEGLGTKASGQRSHVEGAYSVASGEASHAEGTYVQATGQASHAEGQGNIEDRIFSGEVTFVESANSGQFPHKYSLVAESSFKTLAANVSVFTKVVQTSNSGEEYNLYYCGYYDPVSDYVYLSTKVSTPLNSPNDPQTLYIVNGTALGNAAHSEGFWNNAVGDCSHAEGHCTNAVGDNSHTEGDGTLALNNYEHAEGAYNVSNTGTASQTTRHSIGIGGNSSNRKNAFEVMQNGDIYAYGVGGYDGTNAGQNGINTLQDSLYVAIALDIKSSAISAISTEVGKYYRLDVPAETLAITLPTISDATSVKSIVFYITGGTTPAITFTSTHNVYYSNGFAIESGKTYEVNALFNGNAWVVASVEIVTSNS